jgi:integrase
VLVWDAAIKRMDVAPSAGVSVLRVVLLRINEQHGMNLTLHDFRHWCGTRLAADPSLLLTNRQGAS